MWKRDSSHVMWPIRAWALSVGVSLVCAHPKVAASGRRWREPREVHRGVCSSRSCGRFLVGWMGKAGEEPDLAEGILVSLIPRRDLGQDNPCDSV